MRMMPAICCAALLIGPSGCTGTSGDTTGTRTTTKPVAAPTAPEPVTTSELVGTWEGAPVSTKGTPRRIVVAADGTWTGSLDGCTNIVTGRYTVTATAARVTSGDLELLADGATLDTLTKRD